MQTISTEWGTVFLEISYYEKDLRATVKKQLNMISLCDAVAKGHCNLWKHKQDRGVE